jgi:hypothetical protein
LETRDSTLVARVTPAEHTRLHREAARCGVTLAEAVREGTRLYLRRLARDLEAAERGA